MNAKPGCRRHAGIALCCFVVVAWSESVFGNLALWSSPHHLVGEDLPLIKGIKIFNGAREKNQAHPIEQSAKDPTETSPQQATPAVSPPQRLPNPRRRSASSRPFTPHAPEHPTGRVRTGDCATVAAMTKRLNPKQIAFVDEYMKDRNASAAYVRAGYSPKGANANADKLTAKHHIAAEIAKRADEYTRAAGIEAVKILEFLRDAMFVDVIGLFTPDGKLLAPSHWPDDVKKLVTSYNAATVTAGEKITLSDRIQLGFKLLEYLKGVPPTTGRAPLTTSASTWTS